MEVLTMFLLIAVVAYVIGGCLPGKDYRPACEQGLQRANKVALDSDVERLSVLRGAESSSMGLPVKYIILLTHNNRRHTLYQSIEVSVARLGITGLDIVSENCSNSFCSVAATYIQRSAADKRHSTDSVPFCSELGGEWRSPRGDRS